MLYGHGRGCGEARWSRRAVWQHQVLTGLQSGSKGSRRRCVKGEERRGTSSQKSSTGPAAETERVSEHRRCSHLCSSVIIASIVCIRLEHLQEPRDGVKHSADGPVPSVVIKDGADGQRGAWSAPLVDARGL